MADGISADFSDVLKLAVSLENASKNAGPFVVKAMKVTSHKVDDDWSADVAGSTLAPGGERAISYDITSEGEVITSEIGPTLGGAGSLVGLLEYGTPTTGPRGFGAASLERNAPDFEKGIAQAVEDGERAAGL